jgi:hypothetical protein
VTYIKRCGVFVLGFIGHTAYNFYGYTLQWSSHQFLVTVCIVCSELRLIRRACSFFRNACWRILRDPRQTECHSLGDISDAVSIASPSVNSILL